ncbi:MAG: hypothetical protein D3904_13310 [Candidatus Electrothrix sp. EH2]|nr:hypothetical protein [Candidatus Electrothrix sp. EH2]
MHLEHFRVVILHLGLHEVLHFCWYFLNGTAFSFLTSGLKRLRTETSCFSFTFWSSGRKIYSFIMRGSRNVSVLLLAVL